MDINNTIKLLKFKYMGKLTYSKYSRTSRSIFWIANILQKGATHIVCFNLAITKTETLTF